MRLHCLPKVKYAFCLLLMIKFFLFFKYVYLINWSGVDCASVVDQHRQCFQRRSSKNFEGHTKPIIYLITPTYDRPEQLAELTRLSQTLLLVPRLHWLVVEDSPEPTLTVTKFLQRLRTSCNDFQSDLQWTHLYVSTPPEYKLKEREPNWKKPRGVEQRNLALKYLRNQSNYADLIGVVYFCDDDNTYDIRIFERMRYTRKVSIWPVGLVGGLLVEQPIVDELTNRVIGFNSKWKPQRKYPIDMAAFAVNLSVILNAPDAAFSNLLRVGYQETHFLDAILTGPEELEPKCQEVLVWHTRTRKFVPMFNQPKKSE